MAKQSDANQSLPNRKTNLLVSRTYRLVNLCTIDLLIPKYGDKSNCTYYKYSTYVGIVERRVVRSIDDRLIVVQIVLSKNVYGAFRSCGIRSEFKLWFELNCLYHGFHVVKIKKIKNKMFDSVNCIINSCWF